MATKCFQLTAISVHLHMKACVMNRHEARVVCRPFESAESMVPMLMGEILRSQVYKIFLPNMLLKGSLTDL